MISKLSKGFNSSYNKITNFVLAFPNTWTLKYFYVRANKVQGKVDLAPKQTSSNRCSNFSL